MDDNILLSKSLSLSLSSNPPREARDSSDDESNQPISASPQSKITSSFMRTSHTEESASPYDISVDYWTIIGNNSDNQKEKKEATRTIKASLKSNIRMLTITRQATINADGKISSSLTMTYITREKKQKSKCLRRKIAFQCCCCCLKHFFIPLITVSFDVMFASYHGLLPFGMPEIG
jgi:hypothetical protein